MADEKISLLNSLGTPDDNDLIPVVDVSEILPSNQNKKFSFLAFKNYVLNALTTPLHKNTHVVGGTDAFVVTDLLNAVAKVGIRIANILIGQRRHINFIAGTNVTITGLDDNINEKVDVTINSTATGNVGDITGGLNVGTGETIFKDKVVNDLRFKSIDGTGIATVTTNGDTIEVNVPANTGEANTGSNVGTGGRVFKIKNGVDFEHKTLVSTPSLTITENPNDLTFVANDLTTISHIGGGLQIAAKTLLNTQYNTFSAGANMFIVPTLGNYVINTSAQPNAGLNLGAGQQVFKQVNVGGIPEYRTLTNGTGITLSSSGTEINVTNSLPMISGNFIETQSGNPNINGIINPSNGNTNYLLLNTFLINIPTFWQPEEMYIFGNNNNINIGGVNKLSIIDASFTLSNTILNGDASGGVLMILSSINNADKLIFKNCVFKNLNDMVATVETIGEVLFDNCIFYADLTGTFNGLISFLNVQPTKAIFKDCVFYYDGLPTISYSIHSNVPVTIRLIGKNTASLPASPSITFVGESLTVDPTLTYIV